MNIFVLVWYTFCSYSFATDAETTRIAREMQMNVSKKLSQTTDSLNADTKMIAQLYQECQIQLARPEISPSSCILLSKLESPTSLKRFEKLEAKSQRSQDIRNYIQIRQTDEDGTLLE